MSSTAVRQAIQKGAIVPKEMLKKLLNQHFKTYKIFLYVTLGKPLIMVFPFFQATSDTCRHLHYFVNRIPKPQKGETMTAPPSPSPTWQFYVQINVINKTAYGSAIIYEESC